MTEYIEREQAIRFAGYSAGLMYKRGYLDEYYALEKFEGTLGRIPAADVAPVVHGRWLCVDTDIEQFFLCNRCKNKEYWESNYCPHCGAKMDEEGNDD